MSFLQDTTLLPSTLQHGNSLKGLKVSSSRQSDSRQLRSQGSIASLLSAARNPVATIGDVFDGLRDGLTKEERLERQRLDNQKQILYIRLRDVSEASRFGLVPVLSRANNFFYSLPTMSNGRLLPKRSMTSRAMMPGNQSSTHLTTTLLSLQVDWRNSMRRV